MEKLVITVAPVGSMTTRDNNPHVPITPKEIAESAVESYHAGAAICHIHVRDPVTHEPSMKLELYEEAFNRIRDQCDMIINLSTGAGARLYYTPNAQAPWNTSELKIPEERMEHVIRLKPELCSLDVGTLNFGPRAFVNLLPVVEKMAQIMKEAGTKPELEVFDIGHIRITKHLISKELIESPPIIQFCLGIPWGIDATIQNIVYMHNSLPRDAIWYAFAVGAQHFTMATASIIMGGHVRVGLEDNIYIGRKVLATSNSQMVKKVVEIAERLDRNVATAKEARRILGLSKAA